MVSVGDADLRSMDGGRGGYNTNLEDTLQTELEFLLQARRSRQISDREKELNIHRYGSAPPTVEGSLSAVGGLFGSSNIKDSNCWTNSDNHAIACEDDIRSHPAYLSYYYSRGSVNPRLPPPALSKEDWRVTQRFQVGGGSSIGDLRDLRKNMLVADGNGSSLFSMQPGGPRLSVEKAADDLMDLRMANRQTSTEWLGRGLDQMSGLPSPGLGARRKSFADILQDGPNQYAPLLDQPSRPQSHNSLADMVGKMSTSDSHAVGLYSGRIESMEPHLSGASTSNLLRIPSRNTSDSHSLDSFGSSLSRNRTPEPQLIGGLPGNGFPLVDSRVLPTERKNAIGSNIRNGCTLDVTVLDDVAASLSGLNLSDMRCANQNSFQQHHLPMDRDSQLDFSSTVLNGSNHSMQQLIESNASKFAGSSKLIDSARKNGYTAQMGAFESSAFDKVAIPTHGADQVNFPKRTSSSANLYSKMASSAFESLEGSDDHYYQCGKVPTNFSSHLHGGLSGERKLNSAFDNYRAGSAYTGNEDGEFLQRSAFEIGNDITPALLDPAYVQYLQNNSDQATQAAAGTRNPSHVRDRYGSSAGDLEDLRKAYLEALLAQQKQHYGLPLGKPAASNHRNQGNLKYGHLQYPGNTKANSGIPSVGYDNLMMQDERIARFTSMMRSSSEASISPWSASSTFNVEGKITSSLLDEFKNNKIRSFELSDISGHIVEFSSDQYGSRFIQQKLEIATEEEKNKIFPEIMPHARTLMTDVFGNYVIQKFFEHGTEIQRKELASQLTGHVLPLSLQMYGCRVIQKALEVVDVEQQTQMVAELDGSIMKCVRDQNGNHVIQKCIECVPQNQIQFIISAFYGQVVALSMHPYGCRVIQRVLEYCDDPSTQEVIMDEIMQSVITLAQDQYGNYVIQHVLEHGKSHERSAIVNKLAGQIVRMSQQKFASNVIEKCLTFGSPEERQILIQEIIGFTDENEPLQAMMRDPFGNYVVQKVLETCDDRSLEFILSRIKVHLNTLKRYTYGKHIVSRVEKLITAGERRIGMSAAISSGVM